MLNAHVDWLEKFVDELDSIDAAEARTALEALSALTPGELRSLLDLRNREWKWTRANPYGIRTAYAGLSVLFLAFTAFVLVDRAMPNVPVAVLLAAIPFIMFHQYVLVPALTNKTRRRQFRAARRIAGIDLALQSLRNKNCAAMLVPLLEHGEESSVPAEIALTTLLPMVREGEGHLIPNANRPVLYGLLENAHPEESERLLLAILSALGAIGGHGCIPSLEVLTHREPRSPQGARVRNAAQACLRRVQTRLEQEAQKNVLLRPAADPMPDSSSLLRPAQAGPETDPRQLLRPVVDD